MVSINLLNSEKICSDARSKVINDFFPEFKEELLFEIDDEELAIHAGALCLYATILLTKIHDRTLEQSSAQFDEIELQSNEREIAIRNAIITHPNYSHYTEEQINAKAHEMLLTDIRNAFAHGNFDIDYNVYSKNLNFVLQPRRKDININEPIIISKNALKKALFEPISSAALKYKFSSVSSIKDTIENNLNTPLKSLMLPYELMRLADYYLEKSKKVTQKPKMRNNVVYLLQYILLITQITYEQDDYYNIFGKNSDVFNKIAIARNANAHGDNLIFGKLAENITYIDRNKTLEESLQKSIASLLLARNLKEDILTLIENGQNQETINTLRDKMINAFSFLFNSASEIEIPDFTI